MHPKTRFFHRFLTALPLFFLFFAASAKAEEHGEGHEETFSVKALTDHHLLDNYDWEFGTLGTIHLPRIVYSQQHGLEFFANTEKAVEAGYVERHEFEHGAHHGDLLVPEAKAALEGLHGKELEEKVGEYAPMDFSITKNVVYLFICAALMLFFFLNVAAAYKRRPGQAPKGMQNFFETIIVFLRDEVAKPNIGYGHERYMPLLLTVFFFIWFLNLLGMTPFSGNVTGNISVTVTLAVISLLATLFATNKHFWGHIFNPPVPHAIKPILVPVEIMGILTKPFALTVRLFANITAGHVIMVSLMALIFIFGKMGDAPGTGFAVGIGSTIFIVAISMLELFVALLQAYVFTMLTAVFIGQAKEGDHHHETETLP